MKGKNRFSINSFFYFFPQEKCRELPAAKTLAEKLEECNNRVNSRSRTTENCTEELFDLIHAIDHCVTKDLFSRLK